MLETPGHTDDHLAYALFDTAYPDKVVGVFTGDALFVGDVGRTDFYPERREEVAGLLYDSLQKYWRWGIRRLYIPLMVRDLCAALAWQNASFLLSAMKE